VSRRNDNGWLPDQNQGLSDRERFSRSKCGDLVRTYLAELQAFVALIATLPPGLGEVIKMRNETRWLIDWQNDAGQRKE
jgi:hypothetical protein